MSGLQRERLLSYTENTDQRNEQANPEPNPGNADPSPRRDHLPYIESRDQGDEQANPDPNPNPSPQPWVSLSPSSRALSKPIEVDNGEKCAAAPCRTQHFREKNVQWVLCELCNSWLHVYCEHITKQELKLIRKYVCHSCKC